jgi:magnesium-transporting ATPase (P-type)
MAKQPLIRPAAEVQELIDTQTEPGAAFADVNTAYNAEINYLLKKEVLASLQQNNRDRFIFARYTFIITCAWIFIVIIIVFLNGYRRANGNPVLQLSDSVLIALITTTTINVFGFFLLVIKFLFNTGELAALTALFNNDATQRPVPQT